jgi:hypothetical protein
LKRLVRICRDLDTAMVDLPNARTGNGVCSNARLYFVWTKVFMIRDMAESGKAMADTLQLGITRARQVLVQ